MKTATQACYWIVGAGKAPAIAPFVAIDLHDATGELVGTTRTIQMGNHDRGIKARELATQYAKEHGIAAKDVTHDSDSTSQFKDA